MACGPVTTSHWSRAPSDEPQVPDLQIKPCRGPSPACQLQFQSGTGHTWSFSLSETYPCSMWLDAQGQWQTTTPSHPVLELWLGALPNQRGQCPDAPPSHSTTRWMLLDKPVESASFGGMGTRHPQFTWSRQSGRVQTALLQGAVDGVISLSHGESELLLDLELATMRSHRQWLRHRIFSLVIGQNPALGPLELSEPARSHRPELWSRRQDIHWDLFDLRQNTPTLQLWARRPGRIAAFAVPRFAPAKPAIRPRAHVEPCLDCGPRREHP